MKALLVVIAIASSLPGATATAQDVDHSYDPDVLARWIKAYEKWDRWDQQWLSKPEPARYGGYLSRKKMPEPPAWLESTCAAEFKADTLLEKGCVLFRQSKETPSQTYLRRHRQAGIDAHEKPTHTSFLEHVHFDGGWVRPQSNARVFAPIGSHVSLMVGNRFEVFLLPGVLLLRAPSLATGNMEWFAAYDYGFGYRLASFQVPGIGQSLSLHANFARAWMLQTTAAGPVNSSIDLVGLSLTFKPRR